MKITVRYRASPDLPVVGVLASDARGRVFFEYDADWRARVFSRPRMVLRIS